MGSSQSSSAKVRVHHRVADGGGKLVPPLAGQDFSPPWPAVETCSGRPRPTQLDVLGRGPHGVCITLFSSCRYHLSFLVL